ncbi:MAG: hypothetical protein MUF07_00795 [Steroidobacteraceae bacterium]|jgi:hypothetical protein|nr:hypothetical protein [Steroidobacteraceae bacterium]
MPILNKDTSEERRTGQHSGVTGPDRRLDERTPIGPDDYRRHFEGRFRDAHYFRAGGEWEDYEPAYRYGYDTFEQYGSQDFDEVEADLAQGWNTTRRASRLGWNDAREAVRDAWRTREQGLPGRRP